MGGYVVRLRVAAVLLLVGPVLAVVGSALPFLYINADPSGLVTDRSAGSAHDAPVRRSCRRIPRRRDTCPSRGIRDRPSGVLSDARQVVRRRDPAELCGCAVAAAASVLILIGRRVPPSEPWSGFPGGAVTGLWEVARQQERR
ncbi:hypothetical protein GCM10023320_05550 [Pseudonocardia adelaidensis]|uniref:Uncharacterized protein n=1 Tax=Pseudonocardia adelaidensis TaxID=648754 RepID=A0ABP9N8M5_9PSEU